MNSCSTVGRSPLSPSADGSVGSLQAPDSGGRPVAGAKCSYLIERWAVLSQIGILVGDVWMAAKWACGHGSAPSGDFEFHVEQLRRVCGWALPALLPHAQEWATEPVVVHYPEGPCRIP